MEEPKPKKICTRKQAGIIMVMTGQGKGKTTAALGITLRATGHDMKVCIICFLKGALYSGEIDGIKRLAPNVDLFLAGKGFCGIRGDKYPFSLHKMHAQQAIQLAEETISSAQYDIVILDEINNAIDLTLIDVNQVLALIAKKPPLTHVILTGRNAHPDIIRLAHTVTEMKEMKHAFRHGIEPQKGIDY